MAKQSDMQREHGWENWVSADEEIFCDHTGPQWLKKSNLCLPSLNAWLVPLHGTALHKNT